MHDAIFQAAKRFAKCEITNYVKCGEVIELRHIYQTAFRILTKLRNKQVDVLIQNGLLLL